ncbi:DUF4082 domain-containing protein [Cellulomonas sp.]|uniref:DUF4082 domain-containing protein n=1 Tax=Cellulomonas sp. TaxID=40001 RepID=UPI002811364B|nr:DUF4082 domain-containing protein [Cellulomonas sp.]
MSTTTTTMRRRGLAALALGVSASVALGFAGPATAATTETMFGTGTPSGVKAATNDPAAVELGTAFTAKATGDITGVRFWKTAGNTGTHTASLWTADGKRLARATFTNETATGWQTVTFPTPVDVTSGSSYVVSYHAPQGRYAYTENYTGKSLSSSMLLPTSNAGRFVYGSGGFPKQSFKSTNYWVDAVFTADAPAPVAPTQPAPPAPAPAPSTARPGASNTGVPAGTTLKASGALTITTPNTVIDGYDISGKVVVAASNVTIKNSRIHGNGTGDGISVRSGNVVIQDSEIYNFENAIGYSNYAAYRVNVHSTTGDGVKLGSNTTLQDSWIHDLTPGPGAHADGGQVQDGIRNLVVRNNTIDVSSTTKANAALFIAPDFGPTTDGPVLVEGNYLNGGGFTVFVVDGNNGQYVIRNITFRNNTFGRTAQYGQARINVPVTWTNNVFADNGAAVRY